MTEIVDLIEAELARHTLGLGGTCVCGGVVGEDDVALPEWDRHLAAAVAAALTTAGRLIPPGGGEPETAYICDSDQARWHIACPRPTKQRTVYFGPEEEVPTSGVQDR